MSWKNKVNNFRTTLTAPLTATGVSMAIATVAIAPPSSAQWRAQIWDAGQPDATTAALAGRLERVIITSGSAGNYDITRAQEGTTALSFAAGAIVELPDSAQDWEDVQSAIDTINTALEAGTSGQVLTSGGAGVFPSWAAPASTILCSEFQSNTATAIPNWSGTNETFVQWDGVVMDHLGLNPAAGATSLTIAAAGIYAVEYWFCLENGSWTGDASGILRNSSTWGNLLDYRQTSQNAAHAAAFNEARQLIYPCASLSAGDILRLCIISAGGMTLQTNSGSTPSAKISIKKIG